MIDLSLSSSSHDLADSFHATAESTVASHDKENTSVNTLNQQELLSRLESLLVAKANEIRLAGTLGQALLTQQAELESRIKDLNQIQPVFINNIAQTSPLSVAVAERRARKQRDGKESDEDNMGIVEEETRVKLEALEATIKEWDGDNDPLYAKVGAAASTTVSSSLAHFDAPATVSSMSTPFGSPASKSRPRNGTDSAPPATRILKPMPSRGNLSHSVAASPLPPPLPTDPTSPSSRRARNNASHRTNDIELATDIGTSLLTEVRRLQGVLAEKEELLKEKGKGKEALERELESAVAAKRTAEESIDKYKEENWNLELSSQDIATQFSTARSSLAKADVAVARLNTDLSSTRESLDTSKLYGERVAEELEALKGRFELEMAGMRKHSAGLQREKSDLLGTLEGLKSEAANRARGIKRSSSHVSTINGIEESLPEVDEADEDELFGKERGARRKTGEGYLPASTSELFSDFDENEGDPLNSHSPLASRWEGTTTGDVDDLRLSLSHAQRTIATLRNSLAKEKSRRMEGASPSAGWEETSDEGHGDSSRELSTPHSVRSNAAARGSARGSRGGSAARRRRGSFLPSRLGREVAGDTSIEEDEDEEMLDSFEGQGGIFDHQFPSSHSHGSPTPLDGDDHSEEDESMQQSESMNFDSPVSRRQSNQLSFDRDSAPAPRPASISSMSFLKDGRSLSGSILRDRSMEVAEAPKVVWVNEATMTDPIESPAPIVISLSHFSTQTTPEPVIAPIIIDKSHFAAQTDPLPVAPVIVKSHFSAQTDPLPIIGAPAPVVIIKHDISAQTNPIPIIHKKEMGIATDFVAPPSPPPTPVLPVLREMGTAMTPIGRSVEFGTATEPVKEVAKREIGTSMRIVVPEAQSGSDRRLTLVDYLTSMPTPASMSNGFDSPRGGDTETEDGFEDAREGVTPALTPAFAPGSWNAAREDLVEGVNAGLGLSSTALREVVEVGVQTDDVYIQSVAERLLSQQEEQTPRPHLLVLRDSNRESINTFGKPEPTEDELEVLAAVADAYSNQISPMMTNGGFPTRTITASPLSQHQRDSMTSIYSEPEVTEMIPITEVPASKGNKDKGREEEVEGLMGPPPTPSSRLAAKSKSVAVVAETPVVPPSRPTSPPPADLLFRAQSPTYDLDYERNGGSTRLYVPGSRSYSSQSMGPTSLQRVTTQVVRPRASTAMGDYGTITTPIQSRYSSTSLRNDRRHGASSSMSDAASFASRRTSGASDRTSEGGAAFENQMRRNNAASGETGGETSDPAVIHAITQTMIGEFLYKYTRRTLGKGYSEKRHKRFFWIHPYSKTMYWSASDHGAQGVNQSSSKSVCITGVRQVIDPNPSPPGLHNASIIIKTNNREMKLTAPTRERHDMWFNAINYLIARPDSTQSSRSESIGRNTSAPNRRPSAFQTPSASKSFVSTNGSTSDITPRADLSTIKRKRGDESIRQPTPTPTFYSGLGSARSRTTFADDDDSDLEVVNSKRNLASSKGAQRSGAVTPVDSRDLDDSWEGLENVRACCGGKHDVGSLSRGHVHSHQSEGEYSDASVGRRSLGARAKLSLGNSFSRRPSMPTTSISAPSPIRPLATSTNSASLRKTPLY